MQFRKYSHSEFLKTFIAILKDKKGKNNTYKFALARFLLEYSISDYESNQVPYPDIAKCFFKYYWLQECKSRLRQGPRNQPPRIISKIRKEFPDDAYPVKFDDMCKKNPDKIKNCIEEITKICRKDVIHRFQQIGGSEKKLFYDYFAIRYNDASGNAKTDPKGGILLNKDALRFFRNNFSALYLSVILEWIRFLERRNSGIPNLVKKIEGMDKGPRDQNKFKKCLTPFEINCFYCGLDLKPGRKTHVDHVIPFDYIADTNLWNLVLACQGCNCEKLGSLPPKIYIDKLITRNAAHKKKIPKLEKSLDDLKYDDRDIYRHYSNANEYGYAVLENFPRKR